MPDEIDELQVNETEERQKRLLPLTNLQIILIALIVVGGRLAVDFSQRIIEGQEKLSEQRSLEAEIDSLEEEQKQLEAVKTYYNSPAFTEEWAHSEGKMVRPGEKLVIPIYDDPNQAVPVAPISDPVEPLPAWRVWWTLFFDTPPPGNLER